MIQFEPDRSRGGCHQSSCSVKEVLNMSRFEKKRRTVLHFGTDRVILLLRAWSLIEMGYRVLNACNATEAIKLATRRRVDAVVLDLDGNHAEVTLVATAIRRCRPRVPTILLAEGTADLERVHELTDALVPKRDDPGMLIAVLDTVLNNVLDNVLAAGAEQTSKVLPRTIRSPRQQACHRITAWRS
jgi:DNA-binding response OmpR family regulator